MIVTLALRIFTVILAAIVLGLSISLYKGENTRDYTDTARQIQFTDGGHPAQTNYIIFCGAWALLFALIGIGAIFLSFLQGIIMMALDVLSALFTLAGGIEYAVSLHGGSCTNTAYLQSNRIIRAAGTAVYYNENNYSTPAWSETVNLGSRCREAYVITVFLFFIFACFLVTGVLGFMGRGRKGSGHSYV